MIRPIVRLATRQETERPHYLGTPGRLAILIWSLAMVLLVPADRVFVSALLAFVGNSLLYPGALRKLTRPYWLIFAGLLVLPSLIWAGEPYFDLLGLPLSHPGAMMGLGMLARAAVVILAVEGFSKAVDISEVAGLFERLGLPGLGFSVGVAVNLLPLLRHSGQCAWHTLRMRGGFRRQWWRGLRLLLVTVVANALRRAEEIALAAEVRAFSPGRSPTLPLRKGALDGAMIVPLLVCWLALVFWGI
jgi:energy-coupling factor transporter transmembrane protein EcfT